MASVAKCQGLRYQAVIKTLLLIALLSLASAACSTSDSPPPESTAELSVSTDQAVSTVDPHYLSVAVDMAQVVGGRFWSSSGQQEVIGEEEVPEYDFSRPRLRVLASHLTPSFLRIGGSDSDRVIYDMSAEPIDVAPEGFDRGLVWAAEIEAVRDARAPDLPIWLGETGHAQCGGQPGAVSVLAINLDSERGVRRISECECDCLSVSRGCAPS